VSLPVTDGRFRLLDDVHDPAAQLRVEVQVVDVRPEEEKSIYHFEDALNYRKRKRFNIVSTSRKVFVLLRFKIK
jgi:hypothetical protein